MQMKVNLENKIEVSKKQLIIVLLIVISLLFGTSFFGWSWYMTNQDAKNLKTNLNAVNSELITYRDENGRLIAEKQSLNLTVNELIENGNLMGANLDELKAEVGNLKNLVSRVEIQGKTNGVALSEINNGKITKDGLVELLKNTSDTNDIDLTNLPDTLDSESFSWTNDYLTLNGVSFKSPDDIKKMVAIEYEYNPKKITATVFRKRTKIFKPKETTVKISFDDPNFIVNDVTSIVIKEDPPKFYETTGFKVGAGFVIGVGLTTTILILATQ